MTTPARVTHVLFSPDSRTLACVSGGTVRLYRTSGERIGRLQGFGGDVLSCDFSPDGTRLALSEARLSFSGASSLYCRVTFWDVESREQLLVLPRPPTIRNQMWTVWFRADGQQLVGRNAVPGRGAITRWAAPPPEGRR